MYYLILYNKKQDISSDITFIFKALNFLLKIALTIQTYDKLSFKNGLGTQAKKKKIGKFDVKNIKYLYIKRQ